jgi:N6-adenosine-specific RNA methylase IME4
MAADSLAIFSRGAQMLAEADTVQKAKELKDLALTAKDWAARKGMGEEAIQTCRSYALEAERRMGELLLATERAKGGEGHHKKPTGNTMLPVQPTLAEIGVSKRESFEAQLLASIPATTFEEIKVGKTTRKTVKRAIRDKERDRRRAENAAKIAAGAASKKQSIPADAKFTTILADPPWDNTDQGYVEPIGRSEGEYAVMSIEKLMALKAYGRKISDLADKDAHLYLWVCNFNLLDVKPLFEAWGFRYIAALTWPKKSYGLGNYFRGQTEHVLFGVRGSLDLKRHNVGTLLPTWNRGPRGHSSKPVEFYEFIESCSPGPYLELFAREKRDRWSHWGEDAAI